MHFLFSSRNIQYKKLPFFTITKLFLLFQVTSWQKWKQNDFSAEMVNNEDTEFFHLDENVVINLLGAKSKDSYWLIVDKKYKEKQRDEIKQFRWTKQTVQTYSNQYKRLVEKIELGN